MTAAGNSTPYHKAAVVAQSRRIVRPPLEAGEHLGAVMLLDDSATCDADKASPFRMRRVELRLHVLPFENLHMTAMWARDITMLLRSLLKARRDPTSGI